MDLTIRNENPSEYRAVEELTREAFWNKYMLGCDEHFVLHNIRKSPDFVSELDLVALNNKRIVGHIVYTRGVIRNDQNQDLAVLCFGPISVRPDLQKQGIGGALIRHTIGIARKMGYPAICIYGDPRYYHRFGFHCGEKYDVKTSDGKFAAALLVLELKTGALEKQSGCFIDSPAFQYLPDEFAAYEATFPAKEKFETESQREFKFMVNWRY
jgi:putative acetyltransferase